MLKLEFMPEATRNNFERLKNDARLDGFTLVGGTALALQIGHRVSEDLDFNMFGQSLPKRKLDLLLADLEDEGFVIESLIPTEKKIAHKINTGCDLDESIQDYLVNGAKVTFHSRSDQDRPRLQIEYLKSAERLRISDPGFELLGVQGLFAMKSLVVYDGVRSRDIFDLMVLTRDHGFTLGDAFEVISNYQPARHKDPEHFKSVVTGIVPLDANDEGFSSIKLNVKMQDIYRYFKALLKDHEIGVAQAVLKMAGTTNKLGSDSS